MSSQRQRSRNGHQALQVMEEGVADQRTCTSSIWHELTEWVFLSFSAFFFFVLTRNALKLKCCIVLCSVFLLKEWKESQPWRHNDIIDLQHANIFATFGPKGFCEFLGNGYELSCGVFGDSPIPWKAIEWHLNHQIPRRWNFLTFDPKKKCQFLGMPTVLTCGNNARVVARP